MGIVSYIAAGLYMYKRARGMRMLNYTSTPLALLSGVADTILYYYVLGYGPLNRNRSGDDKNLILDIFDKMCIFDRFMITAAAIPIAAAIVLGLR